MQRSWNYSSAVGPDFTDAGSRFALRDLLEAIVDPSREISDQYGTSVVTLRDGRRLTGRIINYTEQGSAWRKISPILPKP